MISTLGTSPAVPSYRILEIAASVVNGWYYPRAVAHDVNGTQWAQGSNKTACYTQIPVYDFVTLTIQNADVGDTADVWFMLE